MRRGAQGHAADAVPQACLRAKRYPTISEQQGPAMALEVIFVHNFNCMQEQTHCVMFQADTNGWLVDVVSASWFLEL